MNEWIEYDNNGNVINMMGTGTMECQIGESRPIIPMRYYWEGSDHFREVEVDFAPFDDDETQALLAMGFSLAVPVQPDFLKKSLRRTKKAR